VKAKTSAEDFAEAARRHLDDVHAFLVYLTGDRVVAEDLTAETFARALERWHRYDPRRGGPRTWLCQLARSTALDHFRAEDRRRRREGTAGVRSADASARNRPSDRGIGKVVQAAELLDRAAPVQPVRLVPDFPIAHDRVGVADDLCDHRAVVGEVVRGAPHLGGLFRRGLAVGRARLGP